MRRTFFILATLLAACGPISHPAYGMKRLVEVLAVGVTNNSGAVLANGTVTVYDAGTTSLRTIYSDFNLGTPVANPLTLDSAGRAVVYTDKRIKLLIKTSGGSTVRTIDNVGTSDADIAASAIAGGATLDIPVGVMIPYGGTSAPTGWVLADCSTYSQTEYADLYAVYGTTWNVGGEAAGYFRVPCPNGRSIMGAGAASGLTTRTLATKLGAETHTLTAAESGLPAHTHTYSGTTSGQSAIHTHNTLFGTFSASFGADASALSSSGALSIASGGGSVDHTHTYSGTTASTGGSAASSAMSLMQPNLVVNFIIKY